MLRLFPGFGVGVIGVNDQHIFENDVGLVAPAKFEVTPRQRRGDVEVFKELAVDQLVTLVEGQSQSDNH